MNLLIDENLSKLFREVLEAAGHKVVYWREVGRGGAPDDELLEWARANGFRLVTADLDHSAILWSTGAPSPSVIQIRARSLRVHRIAALLVASIAEYQIELEGGALLVLEADRTRVRMLPLR